MASTADANGLFNAKDEVLYVATGSAPATATDPTGYDKVGFLTNNPFSGTADEITASNKDLSGFTSSFNGAKNYTVECEYERPAVEDTGQAILRDAWLNDTTVYWLITSNDSGDTCKHGQATVNSYNEDSPNDAVAVGSATLRGQGAPTFEAVP